MIQHIVLTHENADFDAVAAQLAVYKLDPTVVPVLPERLNRNVAHFLALFRNGLPFVTRADADTRRLEHVTLVDTQRPPSIRGIRPKTPLRIIDHHPLDIEPGANDTLTIEEIGATTTLLVEQIREKQVVLNSLEATLLALGIYEDTGSLVYRRTTPRDIRCAAWLVEQGAALDTIRRFLEPPLNDEQQGLLEDLVVTAESRQLQGYTIIIGAARLDEYMTEINAVAHRLRDTLDPDALFLLVEMPGVLHLVCRSTVDAVDVGAVARFFGGGGHPRAAAATIRDESFEQTLGRLWERIPYAIRPATQVADLMSYGVQTVNSDDPLGQIIGQLRRIGHEGYPVVEDGRVVGLLNRRDADRASEHGLNDLTVRDVMTAGNVTLRPTDSVQTLEQCMVESGWGQLPVVDQNDRLIGIITRTDLIKHWAQVHPTKPEPTPQRSIDDEQIATVLGKPIAHFISHIAEQGHNSGQTLYMVGGVVRDLLLQRPNFDIDFVVEGDAINFAESLCSRFGGHVNSYRPFGTAKWVLNGDVSESLNVPPDSLPDHIDFASARNEFYEHPTALPTVYQGSIKLDLHRRDFTINTLAVQLSPPALQGQILDYYNGLSDLQARLLRVLHSLSFVDDPTRILRATRFEQRLSFEIEPRTLQLIQTALPMLRRITGERLRNEFHLMFKEQTPENGLLKLQDRGILTAIHPAFRLSDDLPQHFATARATTPPATVTPMDQRDLCWHIIAAGIDADAIDDWCERLHFGRGLCEALIDTAQLQTKQNRISTQSPSELVEELESTTESAILTTWLISEDARVREQLDTYLTTWRHVRPTTTGHSLRERRLPPGPCYAIILKRLRAARLDGIVKTDEQEQRLLEDLISEGLCDDRD